jgi:hypothetical protein
MDNHSLHSSCGGRNLPRPGEWVSPIRLVPPLQGWCFWVNLKPRAALRSALG